jgi:hypothetical protein
MIRALCLSVAVIAIIGCTTGSDEKSSSVFWDSTGDVIGLSGEPMVYATRDLASLVGKADAVVVGRVDGETSRELASPFVVDQPLTSEAAENVAKLSGALVDTPMSTTSTMSVSRWLSGEGPDKIEVMTHGGFMSDGLPFFLDGTFLLEQGRTYLLALYRDRNGIYVAGSARTGFDLTEGVKVLNYPDTRDLDYLEDHSVNEFVTYIESLLKS